VGRTTAHIHVFSEYVPRRFLRYTVKKSRNMTALEERKIEILKILNKKLILAMCSAVGEFFPLSFLQ
jgi:hypothetical protein